ncbi:MAG: ABC transporter permease [Bernardetiaceae bacterium]|nr:ABC transporter permease [Bernardetiaceae bacterium]
MDYLPPSPLRVVLQKLFANRAAVLGLMFIALAHLVAFFGYLIMADDSPNADESMQEIKKKGLMFKVTVLKDARDVAPSQPNLWQRLQNGREHPYKLYAVAGYQIRQDSVFYRLYSPGGGLAPAAGQAKARAATDPWRGLPLIDLVKPLYRLPTTALGQAYLGNFYRRGDSIVYVDLQEKPQTVALADLKTEFLANHVQQRTFYLGTDRDGRDLASRLIYGTRLALAIGFVSVLISLLLGVSLGAAAGFFGGLVDRGISLLMTVVWSIPSIMLVVAFRMALSTTQTWVLFVAVGLTTWVEVARVVRGEIMSVKQKLYIEAARAFGFDNFWIISRHILPNIAGSIIVMATSNFATAILLEAGLSFMGLGVQAPTPSWGGMLLEGYHETRSFRHLHLIALPSTCIGLLVLSLNLVGNGLRDAFDPKTPARA